MSGERTELLKKGWGFTMCGICGFANYKNEPLLKAMTARLEHRGPDEDGFFNDGEKVSLGMRRLKIIDLATGAQPISNEDGSVTVVFNGEIYNFRELRAELEAKGHRFRTQSDTETLVHLYEEYGAGFPARLRGMFAFALWDAKTQTLLLARDQFGIKPLFYAPVNDKLFFASEIKSLLLSPEIPADLDLAALDAYFSYLYSPSPHTVYKHIKKLEPAKSLAFKAGKILLNTYWRVPAFSRAAVRSEGEYLEGIADLLEKSVTEQLVSDVPLGLLLSGGMDSSTALYYMARASGSPVKTFTVGYGPKDASFNEADKARLVAAAFRTEHHETIFEPDIRAVIEKLSLQFDEPFANASAIPTYLVTKEARKNVTVALTGIGGDEIFGGYPRHLGARLLSHYLKAPGFLREGIWAGAKYLSESTTSKNLPGRVKRFLRGAGGDFRSGYESWISYFSGEEKARLYGAGLMPVLSRSPYPLPGKLEDPDDVFAFETRNYLSDDLLCLADRTSMANSLELRVPFLDVRLVEFMASAPLALKTRGFSLKYLLKKTMAGRLPAEILGAGKMGFQVPLARWYNEEIKDFAREVLSPAALRKSGCLNPAYVSELLKEHESGRRNLSDQIYAAMMFELWLANSAKKSAMAAAAPQAPATETAAPAGRSLTVLVCSDIIPCDEEGGSGRVAWELALQLLKKSHKVLVLTRGSAGKKDFEVVEGAEVYRYGANPFRARGLVKRMLEAHKKIDVLELHHPYTAFWALRLLKGVPAVYHFHSPWAEEFSIRCRDLGLSPAGKAFGVALRKLMERRVLKTSKAIFSASAFIAGNMRAAHGLDSKILPLGVDTRKFIPAPDTAPLRTQLGVPEDRFMIFTVRNLVSRMGLENLVEAAASVAKKEPKTFFIIGGRGYLKEKLAGMIAGAGLGAHVRLEGYIPEEKLPLYYQCADLFVLPTRLLEGFGLVTLEALACGTPVLATPVAANVEVLGAFDKSLLLKSEAPGDIAGGILAFMAGYEERRARLRAGCRRFVELNYSWDRYAGEVEKVLYEAVSDG